MCLNGLWNMAAYFPMNGIAPDMGKWVDLYLYIISFTKHMPLYVGPKMYFGQYSISSSIHQSSTKLHMDVTDAYNEMIYASKCPDRMLGCALWHIWDTTDAVLHKFLRDNCGFTGPEDAIHSQDIHVTPELLVHMFKKCGVHPYTICQYPGDLVFIPAYCMHQVGPFILFTPLHN
jgi:hypothetical protein